jgi:hypothetical protein
MFHLRGESPQIRRFRPRQGGSRRTAAALPGDYDKLWRILQFPGQGFSGRRGLSGPSFPRAAALLEKTGFPRQKKIQERGNAQGDAMARYMTELFAHILYSPSLSYHDLLEREEELKTFWGLLAEMRGGEYLHFEAQGDALLVQCVFPAYGEDLFHALCDALAGRMNGDMEARLLFVSKDLSLLHLYVVSRGRWRESLLRLPLGPIGDALAAGGG